MNINDYRKAMDHITPGDELKERIMYQKTPGKRYSPVRRVLAGTLTVVLALTGLTTVALAASPELRAAVLTFFHLEEREQLPGQDEIIIVSTTGEGEDASEPAASGGEAVSGPAASEGEDASGPATSGPAISEAEIGSLVRAQYIRMDQHYGFSGGLFNDLTWSEDGRTLLEADFWEVRDNELIPVQVDVQTNQIDITFRDIRYQGELYWFIRDGELCFFQGTPYGVDMRPEDEWYAEAVPGRTDAVLLRLGRGQQMEYTEYCMLYHLDTGETEDFLAGTGAAELDYAYSYSWSEDMRRVLILCGQGIDWQQEWLCDLDAGTLVRLEDLTGLEEEVSAGFADSDTLILTTHTTEEDDIWQTVTCYAYDIPTGQRTKTLDETQCYQWWVEEPYGVQLFGSRCVLIGQDGQVRLVDLKTGAQTVIEGFTYRSGDKFMPSPSGDKLLYYASDSEVEGLGIVQLGVVDLEKGTFIAFDRDGYEEFYEEGIGWNDDRTVGISARTPDREIWYIILYRF